MSTPVKDNPAKSRYELDVDGKIVFANYRRNGSTLYIPYVEAPPSLRGTGAAGRLMEGVMAIARAEGLTVVPICSYAANWVHRHREHHDLLGR
ncbi:GNAT family N-acetyltransferase [Azospirillum canadense]|uniref:GNAT family N-acetyltransferase n=1 Tax=Azospirillum canadense TaxID=403962 RepID=UPI00222643E9|nr:GNAT family N-acetyltransferase [Azospirillum canadense]MCW2242841.1 putative GNAT family acetyltransferase [Azospirillum canadense]